jgi:3-phytase
MRRRIPFLCILVLYVSAASPPSARAAVVVEVAQELQHGGNNYDDPCFWQDPEDSQAALVCTTSKDDDLVECFALPSGTFVGTAEGFEGAANNCEVDAVRGELVTTDNGGDRVLVHALPALGAPIRILDTPGFRDVTGVCVGHRGGRSLVFVTDESAGRVFVLDSVSGEEIGSFDHGHSKAEGIACDDAQQRVYVCDDESDSRSCKAFTFEGAPVGPEFGVDETGSDSEGVTLYECGPADGYIIVSDQSNDEFEVFTRREPFAHLCTFELATDGDRTNATDGIEVVQIPAYPNGIFGACDSCGAGDDELDLVPWERIAAACALDVCPLGRGDGAPPAPAPRCGDGRIDAGEECDGGEDALCPGECRVDCRCPGGGASGARAVVVADGAVRSRSPDGSYDGKRLDADARSPKRSMLRILVTGVDGRSVGAATLELTVSKGRAAESDHGGELRPADCGWDEASLTWDTMPAVGDAIVDARPERVRPRERVAFDLTGAIAGDGEYCFALTSPSGDGVRYESRERRRGPRVALTVEGGGGDGMPRGGCGDGVARGGETCDGPDDTACPGRCRDDCTCPPRGEGGSTFSCLASPADEVLSGTFTDGYYTRSMPPGTVIDATAATFVHCSRPAPGASCATNIYPVNLGPASGHGACWSGGLVVGENDPDASWEDMHDPNNAGFAFENASFTLEGLRMHNVGDGIRPRGGAQGFLIKDVWLSGIRDDCIENDHFHGGTIADSLFDGCFSGFSARRSDDAEDGRTNVVTIRNTLVRLEAMPDPPDGGSLGHKAFFKWMDWGDGDSPSPRLALYDNVFMAEQRGETSDEKMGIPPGKLDGCANNLMVWLGPGDYPAVLPDCFTIVTERAVWDRARADWIARHPGLPAVE